MRLLSGLEPGLVVSCQADPGDPMDEANVIEALARAAINGGAKGLRIQGLRDLARVCPISSVPVIGLWKDRVGHSDVFITPTLRHAIAVAETGAHIVALDATRRPRPDGLSIASTIVSLRSATDAAILADVADIDDAQNAVEAGADAVATTLSGYVGTGAVPADPDVELVHRLVARLDVPVIAEGRFSTPEQAQAAIAAGAYAVVVGTAITRIANVTSRFVKAVGP